MKKDASITVRVDSEIKAKAEAIMNDYGLNMSTAVDMLLHQIVRQNAIPLSLTVGEPDPILLGIERARTARSRGAEGTPARQVAEKMRAAIQETAHEPK